MGGTWGRWALPVAACCLALGSYAGLAQERVAPALDALQPMPVRVVSLNPCTDAILAQVADPGQIAGLSQWSSDPVQSSMDVSRARSYPAMSGALEEVVAARPDLVLASTFTPPATRAAMARLGLRMVPVGLAGTVAQSEAQVRDIARLVGHPERGEALVRRIEQSLSEHAPPAGARPIPTLLWHGGGLVPGANTLISELMARTGLTNFASAKGLRQSDRLPLEALVADPPPLIVVVTRSGEDGRHDRVLTHPALNQLQHTRRIALDPRLEYCGGPTIITATAALAHARMTVEGGAS